MESHFTSRLIYVKKEREMIKAKTSTKAGTQQEKMTRGKVDAFGRDIWSYMKKTHAFTEARMVQLKVAKCPAKVNKMNATLIRIFDPDTVKEKGMTIEDYESLNEHPEVILYEGYKIHGKESEIIIEKRNEAGASLLERKITEGTITEVGVIIPKTGAAKWLGRFGTFMMMGGFLVVLVLIVGIIIAISILSKGC